MKKIISLVLALALLAVPFCGMSLTASAESENLIVNGDFENGKADWDYTGWDAGSIVQNGWEGLGHSGSSIFKVAPNDFGLQQFINLNENTTYVLSFKAAALSDSAPVAPQIKITDKATGTIYLDEHPQISQTVMNTFSFVFTATQTGEAELLLFFINAGAGAYIDDVSLTVFSDECISNGGFDTDENWQLLWDTSIVSSPAAYGREGNSVLNMKNYAGGALQTIQLEKGVTYYISFKWAPGASGGSSSSVDVRVFTGSDGNAQSNWVYNNTFTSQNYAYTDCGAYFTATETTEAKIWLRNPVSASNTYIDDVSVKKIPDECVSNGGFENGEADWDNTGWDAGSFVQNGWEGLGHSGSSIFKVAPYDFGLQQFINLNENTTYVLSFKAAAFSESAPVAPQIKITDKATGTIYLDEYPQISQTDMNTFSFVFTATQTGESELLLFFMNAGAGAYIDDVSVKRVTYSVEINSDAAITMDDNYIYGAADVDSVLAAFILSNATVECNSDVVKTGAKVTVKVEGAELYSRELVLSGDVNGDAVCNLLDFIAVKKQASGVERLSGAFFKAACFNDDDVVNADDLAVIKQTIMG